MAKLYDINTVRASAYYEVIDMMGEDGLDAKLTAYDLLAVMAAPCTRLDYEHTGFDKRTPLIEAVHLFVSHNARVTNMTHQGLVKELNRSFLPTLTKEKQEEFLMGFRMVLGFDADGYAIFDKKYYDVYKGNIDKGNDTRVKYAALPSERKTSDLPDKEVRKTYYAKWIDGQEILELDFTVDDWVDILRGASVKAKKLIEAYMQSPDRRATHPEIEANFGISRDSINGITAGLGNRAKRIMGVETIASDNVARCWVLPFNYGRNEASGHFSWQLRPELAEAYEKLYGNIAIQTSMNN